MNTILLVAAIIVTLFAIWVLLVKLFYKDEEEPKETFSYGKSQEDMFGK